MNGWCYPIFSVRCAPFWRGDWLWWNTEKDDEDGNWRAYTVVGLRWVRREGDEVVGPELYLGPLCVAAFLLRPTVGATLARSTEEATDWRTLAIRGREYVSRASPDLPGRNTWLDDMSNALARSTEAA